MNRTFESWLSRGPLLTDGGWGTELQRQGLAVGECPDEWNLSHTDAVREVADAYVAAGSDIILTNTFGANRFTLARHALEDKVVEINTAGVRISRKAAGKQAKVFASVGPTGIMLMMADVSREEIQSAFEVQARAIADAGADAIVIESMSDPDEARLALAAAQTTGLPVVVCMVFDSGAAHDRTLMGNTPEDVAKLLTVEGADAVGANCGNGIERFVPICRRMHDATELPVWIKANAGMPVMVNGRPTYTQSAEEFAALAPQLLDAGASFLGGCCGTTPEFIAAVRAKLPQRVG